MTDARDVTELIRLVKLFGEEIQRINDELEVEAGGDRVYLGSSNDKDALQELSNVYSMWLFAKGEKINE